MLIIWNLEPSFIGNFYIILVSNIFNRDMMELVNSRVCKGLDKQPDGHAPSENYNYTTSSVKGIKVIICRYFTITIKFGKKSTRSPRKRI